MYSDEGIGSVEGWALRRETGRKIMMANANLSTAKKDEFYDA